MNTDKKIKNELKKDLFASIEGTLSGYNKNAAEKFNKSLKLFSKLISKKFIKVAKKTENKKKISDTGSVLKKKITSKASPSSKASK